MKDSANFGDMLSEAEREWLTCSNLSDLLRLFSMGVLHKSYTVWTPREPSLRRWRLLACATSRANHQFDLDAELQEEHSDVAARSESWAETGRRGRVRDYDSRWYALDDNPRHAAYGIAAMVGETFDPGLQGSVTAAARCVLGDPFRQWVMAGVARTRDTTSIAEAAVRERGEDGTLRPDALLALSDALIDAGVRPVGRTKQEVIRLRRSARGCCDDHADYCPCDCLRDAPPDGIIEHLRSPGPHYLGCWAIDLVLGRD